MQVVVELFTQVVMVSVGTELLLLVIKLVPKMLPVKLVIIYISGHITKDCDKALIKAHHEQKLQGSRQMGE